MITPTINEIRAQVRELFPQAQVLFAATDDGREWGDNRWDLEPLSVTDKSGISIP